MAKLSNRVKKVLLLKINMVLVLAEKLIKKADAFYQWYFGVYELELRQKWQKMIEQSDGLDNILESNEINPGDLKRLVRQGIPSELRHKFWLVFCGANKLLNENKNYYENLLKKNENNRTDIIDEIAKDIDRTFPDNITIDQREWQLKLQRVLNAFSYHNPAIGYCQGMNFVTAMLLVNLTEEEAFWILVRIIDTLLPPNFYSSLHGAVLDQAVFSSLLENLEPGISSKLKEYNLPVELITTKWFICLYASVLPTETFFRVWDCFFLEGYNVFF